MMKAALFLSVIIAVLAFFLLKPDTRQGLQDYDIYQYISDCKEELGIVQPLPQLSCLNGTQVPIYVNKQEINEANWKQLSDDKQCDNPHWLGGDVGCWTYSHLQVLQLDHDNIMVVNCRQKGNQLNKDWFRQTSTNLGMNQAQRKAQYEQAPDANKGDFYYLYNTFNDIGIIMRNTRTGKSCYLTQYGQPVVGFLPPLDRPLPAKDAFLQGFKPEQVKPPKDFPQELWYRDANQAFKAPAVTASAGCIDCHNAHGVKYSPYINSSHGLPDIYAMSQLPFLPVGKPFIDHFNEARIVQVTTDLIAGEPQLCTRCHNMTTLGTCGHSIDFATNHPSGTLQQWLTLGIQNSWMPPIDVDLELAKKHIAAIKCCCQNPSAKGCQSRKFGPTEADVPKGFAEGAGWVSGQDDGLCESIMTSPQWNGFDFKE